MSIQLSVFVAVKDVEEFLPQCLESLHKQTLIDTEYILVDDGSHDNCRMICEEYTRKDERFHLIVHERNEGCLATRMDAITRARGEFAIMLDGDDYLLDSMSLVDLLDIARRKKC